MCLCRNRDFYHTCYALSGLSIAQNFHLGRQHHPRGVGHQENQLVRERRAERERLGSGDT